MSKIPVSMRQAYLDRFFDTCIEIYPDDADARQRVSSFLVLRLCACVVTGHVFNEILRTFHVSVWHISMLFGIEQPLKRDLLCCCVEQMTKLGFDKLVSVV